jgi:hypothetical protein
MSLNILKLDKCPEKNPGLAVKVTEMGNIIEIQYMSRRNYKATIKMLPGGDQYLELSTGEIKDIVHHETRADQKKSLARTFKNARGLINSNVTDVSKVAWITLTYAENMTDTNQLYADFRKFTMRFQTYCNNNGYGKAEYIVMMEPQGRGAWHCHLLYLFDLVKAPYIENKTLSDIWGHGFVKIKKLDNVDNVGAYLTAYLGDMDISELGPSEIIGQQLKQVEIEEDGEYQKKYYVKGARLNLYPLNFNMIRCSRGVKRPIEELISQEEAEKKVSASTLTFEKTVMLQDLESDFETIINTQYYNKARVKNQDTIL